MFKEFLKNEWKLFLQDMESIGNAVLSFFSRKEEPLMIAAAPEAIEEPIVQEYVPDEVDYKVETYFGENIGELKESFCGDKTQHEVLREYAQFFKPYGENAEMCHLRPRAGRSAYRPTRQCFRWWAAYRRRPTALPLSTIAPSGTASLPQSWRRSPA